jgi:hypothetical protein
MCDTRGLKKMSSDSPLTVRTEPEIARSHFASGRYAMNARLSFLKGVAVDADFAHQEV